MTEKEKREKPAIEFPTRFPVKVMGRDAPDFETMVLDIFRRHVDNMDAAGVSKRASRDGNFIAITVVFDAQSQAQLDALYIELNANDRVLMTL